VRGISSKNSVKSSEVEMKGSKLWRGGEGCVSVVKRNDGNFMVKCKCISS
jgi:hypothetical protein